MDNDNRWNYNERNEYTNYENDAVYDYAYEYSYGNANNRLNRSSNIRPKKIKTIIIICIMIFIFITPCIITLIGMGVLKYEFSKEISTYGVVSLQNLNQQCLPEGWSDDSENIQILKFINSIFGFEISAWEKDGDLISISCIDISKSNEDTWVTQIDEETLEIIELNNGTWICFQDIDEETREIDYLYVTYGVECGYFVTYSPNDDSLANIDDVDDFLEAFEDKCDVAPILEHIDEN